MSDLELYKKISDIADQLEQIMFYPKMPDRAALRITLQKNRLRELAESLLPQENEN